MPITPTAWAAQRSKGANNTGTFISDRIHTSSPDSSSAGKAKASGQGNRSQSSKSQKAQSPAVQALQKLISNLSNSPDNSNKAKPKDDDPREGLGCFCLAQVHKLSPYISICNSCGLILCEINQPYRPCPYKTCGQPLLSPQGRATLIDSLNEKVARTLEEEAQSERKAIEEQRRAAGAFPELNPQSHGPHGQSNSPHAPQGGTHKVLSLTKKGAVLTKVRKSSPSTTPKAAKADLPPVERIIRIPAPSEQPSVQSFAKDKGENEDARPWENPRVSSITYVPPPKQQQKPRDGVTTGGSGEIGANRNAKKRSKKKSKGEQSDQVVPESIEP